MVEKLEEEEIPPRIEAVRKGRDSGLPNEEQFQWDVFISHASEDKDSFVRGLAQQLEQRGAQPTPACRP